MKLYKVTAWFDGYQKTDTFENFVIAENKTDAKRIVEEEIWTLSGMKIKSVEEIDMTFPQLICYVNTKDIE